MSDTTRMAGIVGPHRESHEPRLLATDFVKAGVFVDEKPAVVTTGYLESDFTHGIKDWGMDYNDKFGCCVIEGTKVQGSRAFAGFKMDYDGPVVELVTESGKSLTVTPNHAVLTPRGFVLAGSLKEGDDVISGRFPHRGNGTVDFDFDQPPTRIEKILRSFRVVRSTVADSDDFHGDGRFMNGDVNVVFSNRFLRGEYDASLSEPQSEEKIETAGQTQGSFHRLSATLKRHEVRRFSALGLMRRSRDVLSIVFSHVGVHGVQGFADGPRLDTAIDEQTPESWVRDSILTREPHGGFSRFVSSEGFSQGDSELLVSPGMTQGVSFELRAHGYASGLQPTSESGVTDPELASELQLRFPKLVSTECLSEVNVKRYTGHVYDLSTEPNWYVANEIIVHNCGFAADDHAGIAKSGDASLAGTFGRPKFSTLIDAYFAYGIAQGEPGPHPDQGVSNASMFAWLYQQGLIYGYAEVPVDSLDYFVSQARGAIIGVVIDGNQASQDFEDHIPWGAFPGASDGHDVLVVSTDGQGGGQLVTWGGLQDFEEVFRGCISDAWIIYEPDDPSVDHDALLAALEAVHGRINPSDSAEVVHDAGHATETPSGPDTGAEGSYSLGYSTPV